MSERYVLDASSLLSLLNDETGADRVAAALNDAVVSTVNYSEVVAKIVDRGGTVALVAAMLDPLHLRLVDFDREQANLAGEMRATTRPQGLSFGDRACLALAASRGLVALTADRAWADLGIGVDVECIR